MRIIRLCIISIRFVKTPLLGSVLLVITSIFISLLVSTFSRKWLRFLVILIFLGGIIVLFVYIRTLINRIKIINKQNYSIFLLASLLLIFISLVINSQYWEYCVQMKFCFVSILFIKSNFLLLRICTVYLLFVLVVRVKLCQKFKGGIKAKINLLP